MKISKIPGLGNYGHYVDDVNFNHITDEEWLEIGKLNLSGLVTILRNVTISKDQYLSYINKFGPLESTFRVHLVNKYGHNFDALDETTYADFSDEEKEFLKNKSNVYEITKNGTTLTKVSGEVDKNGKALGVFDNGDLKWHSNEAAFITFAPIVSLLGSKGMIGSSTGFLQTVDYYESISESFRSELNEIVLVHAYTPGNINQREIEDAALERQIRLTMCPEDGLETPLVVTSPGGYKGLRYTVNTAVGIKGMSKQDSDKLFNKINQDLFTEKYIFDHWYQQDNDLLLFDNSVTLHRRIGGSPDRLAYRYQFFPKNLLETPWQPYSLAQYAEEYNKVKQNIDNLRIQKTTT